ncbi:MAG TPA: PVC-type heme-binding CxxCH protein [Opitutaceae bacterium]|nr:PVC-type heme-binding CxxCH protein [Opitutaceae bacterium]
MSFSRFLLALVVVPTSALFAADATPAASRSDTNKAARAARDAKEAPPSRELVLHKWSGDINVPDPVACAVDPQGRVYVSATTRRKVGDLDIREHTMWIPNDVALDSVDAKIAFYRDAMAPGKIRAPRGGLADHNKDGSIDWKDLTHYSERIYQLRDTDGDGTADKMTVFAEGFNTEVTGIAAGVMYHDGWVYATIAPDLWRLKDTDDDGVADIREVVVRGFGIHIAYAGHDMHGLTVGPDGRIYWSIGDKGMNVTSKEGRKFYHPNEGAVMRIEPDGSGFEVYAHGLRNPQEPAFDDYGDLFAVDNDADQPGERERFVYIAEGSDSGWRCNYQYMKMDSPWMREGYWKPQFAGQAAYLLPPLLSYSDGPAGFRHDPGTALSDAQRGMFLLNEFPSGKMKGFRAERDGASFRMTDARIINDGVMGIGMSWHPDGSLMMVDWIGGYPLDGLGALWRVDAKGGAANPLRQETAKLLAAGFAKTVDAELATLLGHADQRVRQGAQLELAKRGNKAVFLDVATATTVPFLARVHALWGYGQLLRRGAADVAPALAFLRDTNDEIRTQAAKILGDAPAAAKPQAKALIALLADSSPRVRLQSALALGKLGERSAVEALFAMAAKDGAIPVLRHAAVTGLASCASAEQLAAKTDAPINVRLASLIALRRQASPAIAAFLKDSDPLVVEEAARAIHDGTAIPGALPALAALADTATRSDVIMRRAINAGFRIGTPEAAARILAFALRDSAPRAMREEALVTLRTWKTPPPLDRVDGYARTIKPARIDDVLTPKLDQLLALPDAGLKTLAVETMIAHTLKAAPELIAAIVGDTKAAAELRAQALRLMAGSPRGNAAYARALDTALAAETPAPLHQAGLELLLPDNADRLVTEARATLKRPSIAEKQHAIALLAKAGTPAADEVIDEMAGSLAKGTAAPAVTLDVLEALRARSGAKPAFAAHVKAYSATPAAAAQTELLAGGDAMRGRDVVLNHLNANCTACHSVESTGSEVGPNLRAIGSQRDAAYLLESLLAPSAKIATGFGIVNVTLKDRTEITGTLAKETPAAVTVRLFDGTNKTVARTDIATQTPPISIMPPMAGILQPREIRDVVAYLSSLKGGGGRGGRGAAKTEDGN